MHLCVDYVLLAGDKDVINNAIKDTKQKFDIWKEGPLTDYMGCIIKSYHNGGTCISHTQY